MSAHSETALAVRGDCWICEGPTDAPGLVFVNALGTDLHMWDGVLEALGDRYRILRLDAPGNGLAKDAPDASTIDTLATRVLSAMKAANLRKPTLVGLSLGGVIGQHLALNHASRFRRFILANTSARPGSTESWTARIEEVRANGTGPLAGTLAPRWFTQSFIQREPERVAALCAMTRNAGVEGYLGCCEALRAADYRDAIWPIGLDVTVIVSPPDVPTPMAEGHALARRIPGANTESLDTGHISAVEAPQAFAAILQQAMGRQ